MIRQPIVNYDNKWWVLVLIEKEKATLMRNGEKIVIDVNLLKRKVDESWRNFH